MHDYFLSLSHCPHSSRILFIDLFILIHKGAYKAIFVVMLMLAFQMNCVGFWKERVTCLHHNVISNQKNEKSWQKCLRPDTITDIISVKQWRYICAACYLSLSMNNEPEEKTVISFQHNQRCIQTKSSWLCVCVCVCVCLIFFSISKSSGSSHIKWHGKSPPVSEGLRQQINFARCIKTFHKELSTWSARNRCLMQCVLL